MAAELAIAAIRVNDVEQLDWDQWLAVQEQFDVDVLATPNIATFCSGSDWLAAAAIPLPPAQLILVRDGSSWLTLRETPASRQTIHLLSLEPMWGFGSPLLGPDPKAVVRLLQLYLQYRQPYWQFLQLTGIPQESPLSAELFQHLADFGLYHTSDGTHSMQADLSEGAEAFLTRRSAKFRANLRRAERKADAAGFHFERLDGPTTPRAAFNRLLASEQRSWKTATGGSIFLQGYFRQFYRRLLERLADRGRLRLLFARYQDRDVGYCFGGVLGTVYRGLQISYDQDFQSNSIGNLLQWRMIQDLAHEGITCYDLGMEMEYKARWADYTLRVWNLLVLPKG